MEYLLLPLLCVLATAKVGVQSAASKRMLKGHDDVIIFNAGVFLVVALIFIFKISAGSPLVWAFAAAFALCTVCFQLFYTEALSIGNVSLTVMMVNLSMLLPVLVSFFFFGEALSVCRIIGIFLPVIALVCVTEIKGNKKLNKKWLIFSILAAVSNGAIGVTQKIFNASKYAGEREAFISSSYVLAFCLTALILAVMVVFRKDKHKVAKTKKDWRILIFIAIVGMILAIFQWLNNYALTLIEGTLFFPVYSGGSIILSLLTGVIVFKDKLTKRQALGVLVGVISIVLMNF